MQHRCRYTCKDNTIIIQQIIHQCRGDLYITIISVGTCSTKLEEINLYHAGKIARRRSGLHLQGGSIVKTPSDKRLRTKIPVQVADWQKPLASTTGTPGAHMKLVCLKKIQVIFVRVCLQLRCSDVGWMLLLPSPVDIITIRLPRPAH